MSAADRDAGAAEPDRYDVRIARIGRGALRIFNEAGVLTAADVHVARRLAVLGGERDPDVVLAAALAVRAPRLGHVHVDLTAIRATAAVEAAEAAGDDLEALPWPEPSAWCAAVAGSPLVAVELAGGAIAPGEEARPFRLRGDHLYLERLWADERAVADALLAMAAKAGESADPAVAELGRRLFTDPAQLRAAATVLAGSLSVIAGGPGTGKTTTIARTLALLIVEARARGERPPLLALAAPTGKAAARLTEAVHDEARELAVDPEIREVLLGLEAVTLHRLLGRRRDSDSRFRHDRRHPLPHDVIVVDETSMVALSLMARLLEAVRGRARLVLVGDPGQLVSVEAGAVLGDIVAPATLPVPGDGPLGPRIAVLDRVHRFGGAIADLAEAVRRGDGNGALAVLAAGAAEVTWIAADTGADAVEASADPLRRAATDAACAVVTAARRGDAAAALAALGGFRLLCAHRRGPFGVTGWGARILGWLTAELDDLDPDARWYVGRPLLVGENDYELGLFNGDTGVVVARPAGWGGGDPPRGGGGDRGGGGFDGGGGGGGVAAFARRGRIVTHSPARLGPVDTVHAMTIHRSQGSQFTTAAVVLPPPDSRLLTRELLYTAITRAERRLILAGSPDSVRTAVGRPVARASGLAGRLWRASPER